MLRTTQQCCSYKIWVLHFTGTSYSFVISVRDRITKLLEFKEWYRIATRRGNAVAFLFMVKDLITKLLGFREEYRIAYTLSLYRQSLHGSEPKT